MVVRKHCKRIAVACSFGLALVSTLTSPVIAQESRPKEVVEPVFRQAKAPPQEGEVVGESEASNRSNEPSRVAALPLTSRTPAPVTPAVGPATTPAMTPVESKATVPHPLDRAIDTAHTGLTNMRKNIRDYTATLVKRESINGQIGEQEFMKIKIRNARQTEKGAVPFSIYMKFLKPIAGREVIWVEGRDDNKLIVHEPGVLTGFKTLELDPDGALAMRNNRHPVYEAGLENLVKKLIEKAERDRAAGLCEVEYREGAKINGRQCTMIQVTHHNRQDPYEFHQAQVFIDDEMQIPVRYAAYDWPSQPGAEPQLIEEYTYVKVELNVGLTDSDFDPSNKAYNFPGR